MFDSSELDLQLAIQLQEQFEEELKQQNLKVSRPESKQAGRNDATVTGQSEAPLSVSLVDPVWELVDPVPDVHALFCTYNDQFFWGKLLSVSVSWSPRMTLCAGVCSYERRGGLCSIRLSVPLLKLRPRSDLVETLLHEMIHAYLFVTANNRDRNSHGPEFHKHMHRINAKARTRISVYHSFHDEVAVYQQHVWQCDGPCRHQRPYYGLVKRSMNRAPSPNDRWFAEHKRMCGGTFTKIQEPEGYTAKGIKRKGAQLHNGAEAKRKANDSTQDIRKYFTGTAKSLNNTTGGVSKPPLSSSNLVNTNVPRAVSDNKPSSSSGISSSNIRGLGSTASGAIKAVEVGNASRSKIVGFNKGLNKSHSNSAKQNGSNGNSSFKKGGTGGGVALASGGTLVLNPKTTSKSSIVEESKPSNNGNGQGYLLKGKTTGSQIQPAHIGEGERPVRHVSRLLAEYDANVAVRSSKKQEITRPKNEKSFSLNPSSCRDASSSSQFSNCYSSNDVLLKKSVVQNSLSDSDDSDEDDVNGIKLCPLCKCSVSNLEFVSHISVCVGGWSEDLGLDVNDLPLLSALEDLSSSNNENISEEKDTVSGEVASLEEDLSARVEVVPLTSSKGKSKFHGKSHKRESDFNSSYDVKPKEKDLEKSRKAYKQEDEFFISVSDSDEEFDEKYWKKPILSVVQLAQGVNEMAVSRMEASSSRQTTSGTERENLGSNNESSSNSPATYPCPVCGELYTEEYISSVHIGTHFD